jgi:type IV fimbrial biogenesis protein FimT
MHVLRSPWRGFTLVEMAVVMAMLATLMTIAYPSLSDWLARKRVTAAAEALQADFTDARLLAAQRGHTLHVPVHSGGAGAWCWASAPTGWAKAAWSCAARADTCCAWT